MKKKLIIGVGLILGFLFVFTQTPLSILFYEPMKYNFVPNYRDRIDSLREHTDWLCRERIGDNLKEIKESNYDCISSELNCYYLDQNNEITRRKFEIEKQTGYCNLYKVTFCKKVLPNLYCMGLD